MKYTKFFIVILLLFLLPSCSNKKGFTIVDSYGNAVEFGASKDDIEKVFGEVQGEKMSHDRWVEYLNGIEAGYRDKQSVFFYFEDGTLVTHTGSESVKIEAGKTTRQELLRRIGRPSVIDYLDDWENIDFGSRREVNYLYRLSDYKLLGTWSEMDEEVGPDSEKLRNYLIVSYIFNDKNSTDNLTAILISDYYFSTRFK